MSDAPSVDPVRIEGFYHELAEMQMELDADPLALGPKRLNAKTAGCRALLSRTERIFLEVSQDLYWYKREHRKALADFEMAVQELMANNPEVRAGRNITDREAVAHTMLRPARERISVLQFACEDLDAVLTVVKTKRNDLKDIASRLRDQLKICQEEIGLGAKWARASPTSKSVAPAKVSEPTPPLADDVDAFMDEILAKSETKDGDEIHTEKLESEELPKEVEEFKGNTSVPTSLLDEILDEIGDQPESQSLPEKLPPPTKTDSEIDAHLDDLTDHISEPVEIDSTKIDTSLDEILDMF